MRWAFERTWSVNATEATLGWNVLDTLLTSKPATRGDSELMQVIAEHAARMKRRTYKGSAMTEATPGQPSSGETPDSLWVRQSAARVAVTASKNLGRPVDPEIQALADSAEPRPTNPKARVRQPKNRILRLLSNLFHDSDL